MAGTSIAGCQRSGALPSNSVHEDGSGSVVTIPLGGSVSKRVLVLADRYRTSGPRRCLPTWRRTCEPARGLLRRGSQSVLIDVHRLSQWAWMPMHSRAGSEPDEAR